MINFKFKAAYLELGVFLFFFNCSIHVPFRSVCLRSRRVPLHKRGWGWKHPAICNRPRDEHCFLEQTQFSKRNETKWIIQSNEKIIVFKKWMKKSKKELFKIVQTNLNKGVVTVRPITFYPIMFHPKRFTQF